MENWKQTKQYGMAQETERYAYQSDSSSIKLFIALRKLEATGRTYKTTKTAKTVAYATSPRQWSTSSYIVEHE